MPSPPRSLEEAVERYERSICGWQEAWDDEHARAESAEAHVAELERENARLALERDEARFRPGLGDNHHNAAACPYCNPERESSVLAEGAATPPPA